MRQRALATINGDRGAQYAETYIEGAEKKIRGNIAPRGSDVKPSLGAAYDIKYQIVEVCYGNVCIMLSSRATEPVCDVVA
jgi:hypothetical protein